MSKDKHKEIIKESQLQIAEMKNIVSKIKWLGWTKWKLNDLKADENQLFNFF